MIYGGSDQPGYSPVMFPQYASCVYCYSLSCPDLQFSADRWLGQNSKQTKLARQLGDIQIRMRLKVSGSRREIRQEYMPILAYKIVLPLTKNISPVSGFPLYSFDCMFLMSDDRNFPRRHWRMT